jgi:arylsulfatase
VLKGEKDNVRDSVYYYSGTSLYAIRKGAWKAHFTTRSLYSKEQPAPRNPPLLFNLENDPSEKYNLSEKHPAIIAEMKKEFDRHTANTKVVPSNLEEKIK